MCCDIRYIGLLLGLYIILLNKPLPRIIKQLFNNILLKIIILLTIIIISFNNPKVAILLTIAYVITLQYTSINNIDTYTSINNTDTYTSINNNTNNPKQ
jgi:hypothetical protein